MRTQSATVTITRAVTVAGGVFAPGHLGELTQYLPFELVDDVLEQTRTVQRRLRALPSRAGVYFVLALAMFPRLGYARVWGKLTAGLAGLDVPRPVGEGAAGPAPPPGPGAAEGAVRGGGRAAGPAAHARGALRRAAHRRLRRAELPEDPRHRPQPVLDRADPLPDGPGRIPGAAADDAGRDRHPRPAGRRLGSAADRDETALARRLLHLLGPGMLVLLDRAFDANAFLAEIARHRRGAAGPGQVHPQPPRPGAPARRLLPVPPGRPGRADHRGRRRP